MNGKRNQWIMAGIMISYFLSGCGNTKEMEQVITIVPHEKMEIESTPVMVGDLDVSQTIQVTSKEQKEKVYYADHDGMEADQVLVSEGDAVKKGQTLMHFKAGDLEESKNELCKKLAEEQLLYEHYDQLNHIKRKHPYDRDLERMARAIELTQMQIAEKEAALNGLQIIAEEDGVITYVSQALGNAKLNATDKLIGITYTSREYQAIVSDTREFVVGNTYEAVAGVATYPLELTRIEREEGASESTLKFEYKDPDMIAVENKLELVMQKPYQKNVMYLPRKDVFQVEGRSFVYILNEEGYRVAREVIVGDSTEEYIIIIEGIDRTEKVVRL